MAGLNNGINNPGLSDIEGGEPGTMRSLIGSVYEFNGELYAYNFDHAFGGEAQAFVGMMQQMTGADVKASDYLSYMYNSLHNPQKVWKLDDETGKFNECKGFTELMEGTTNEYIWRMGEHNGQLYIASMDAGIFYNYLTQLTNGSFFQMSEEEKISKIGYISDVIKLLGLAAGNQKMDELREKLEQLKALLENYSEVMPVDEETIQVVVDIQGLSEEITAMVLSLVQAKAEEKLPMLKDIVAKVIENIQNSSEQQREAVTALLEKLLSEEAQNTWKEFLNNLLALNIPAIRELFASQVMPVFEQAFGQLQETGKAIYDRVDGKGIEMYIYINDAVIRNEWGFDLIRTPDGENFEVITRNGFDDKYNYGCPSFLSTEEGLYIGTCNPFYGGQLFLLSEKNTMHVTEAETIVCASDKEYYNLAGQRIVQPTRPGIYVQSGRKLIVK